MYNLRQLTTFAGICLFLCSPAMAEPEGGSLGEAIAQIQPRVVKLFGAGGIANLHGYGTGFLVSPQGHIVTVWSHLLDDDVVTVVRSDGRRAFAKVVGGDTDLDLAVLKIDGEDLPFFDLAQAVTASPGARVLSFSNMFKVASGDEPVSVVHGVISAKTKLAARRGRFEIPYHGPVYIVDAITNNPGAAGGVLTTRDGKLLGMIGRELRNAESHTWMNYVIPIGELQTAAALIVSGKSRPDKFAEKKEPDGKYSPLDFGLVLVPDVVARTPAYIDDVLPESAASKAGLKADDLIVFVNQELVQSIKMLQGEFRKLQAEDDLTLVIRRKDLLVTVKLRVPRK